MINRYTRPEMDAIWTLENRYKAWMRVELAICEAWHEHGSISKKEIEALRHKGQFPIDAEFVARALEIEETTRHDVIAFLTVVEERIGDEARFIHLGCTSSDIVDTANALLMVEAGKRILQGFDTICEALKTLSLKHQGLLCMGRTHGIHAEPTSFALKMATFYAEFMRARARFSDAVDAMQVGKLSGAVGTYSLLPPSVEAHACKLLGLTPDLISTQIIQRDRHASYFTTLAIAAGSVERLCVELRHLQRTEVHEVEEGFGKGQKGSSAMPHKKNPISAENMTGLARLIRTNALAALENQALWHERDISHSSVERVIMPDSTILMDYILHRLTNLISNLRVLPENIERNLNGSFGLYFSQCILTALIEAGMPRQEAYVTVQKSAMQSFESRSSFPDIISNNTDIAKHLTKATLQQLFDNKLYLQHENTLLQRVFAHQV